ncbi:MAG: hypothetical protein KC613_23835 [Myxococcales bacterium]|nr:hypothetical protein [Myxococcales bacterium]
MTAIARRLRSALSELQAEFPADPQTLHFAVAAVTASIFLAHKLRVVVVGGQAATHWLRVSSSLDVDLVASDYHGVREILREVGFEPADQSAFRLKLAGPTPATEILVELVGERIQVAGVLEDADAVTTIRPDQVRNPRVRSLMGGDALVLDPCLAFLNYAEASSPDSDWYDHEDADGLAHERAEALLRLYRDHILERLEGLQRERRLPDRVCLLLRDGFNVDLGSTLSE